MPREKVIGDADTFGWWICACVKRKGGTMTHIKQNPPSLAKCRKCGAKRDTKFDAKGRVISA